MRYAPTSSPARLVAYQAAGLRDIRDGVQQWRLWYLLGSSDLRRRYARSKLGQFWITLSSAIAISAMGFVWSFLWRVPPHEMLPFIGVSMIVWQLISGIVTEATSIMATNQHYFLNQYMPASTTIFSLLYRQGITFLLNIIFPIGLALFWGAPVALGTFLVLPGLLLLGVSCFWCAFLIAIFCTRFRDLVQVVNSAMQIAFFCTPVLWKPELAPPEAHAYVNWNPFAVLIALVRDPLLGRPVLDSYWIAGLFIAFGGLLLSLPMIGIYRRRIIYWL